MAADIHSEEARIQDSLQSLSAYLKKYHIDEKKITAFLSSKSEHALFSPLSKVKDPRQSGKIKYSLRNLLMIALLTVSYYGTGSFLSMETYAKANKWQLHKLGLINRESSSTKIKYLLPSHDTFRRVFSLIDPSQVQRVLIEPLFQFIEEIAKPDLRPGLVHIQLDGKEMRGTGRRKGSKKPRRNTNMVNVYYGSFKICRFSVPVRKKSNEIPIVQCILKIIDIKNKIITFDALHTQIETTKLIANHRGFYVTPVKKNHRNCRAFIEQMLTEQKIESKKYDRSSRVFELLQYQRQWEHYGFYSAKMIVKMTSWKHSSENPEIMYFISNTMDEELIMAAIENRWGIEGGFHKDKDSILMNEDKILYTDQIAEANIVMINNLVAAIVRWIQVFEQKMPLFVAKGHFRSHPMEIFDVIFGMTNRELEFSA